MERERSVGIRSEGSFNHNARSVEYGRTMGFIDYNNVVFELDTQSLASRLLK